VSAETDPPLTQYVYNPLTVWFMRRRAAKRLPLNQAGQKTVQGFATMIALPVYVTIGLAGIWHGSGAQFLVFGLLHATYLTVNRAWRLFRIPKGAPGRLETLWRVALTYSCVLVGSVFFRAPSVTAALSMLGGMIGLHGGDIYLPVPDRIFSLFGAIDPSRLNKGLMRVVDWQEMIQTFREIGWLVLLYAIVWGLPNMQQILVGFAPALDAVEPGSPAWLRWRPTLLWGVAFGCLGALGLLFLGGTGEFLYFQF
jgi:alginate O-acetyltransferase complex protein AlgI